MKINESDLSIATYRKVATIPQCQKQISAHDAISRVTSQCTILFRGENCQKARRGIFDKSHYEEKKVGRKSPRALTAQTKDKVLSLKLILSIYFLAGLFLLFVALTDTGRLKLCGGHRRNPRAQSLRALSKHEVRR